MNLLTISGSLRTGSVNTRLLDHLEELARDEGHQVCRFDRAADIPPFNEDHESRPHAAVDGLPALLHSADAVLIATPEYSGSIPGQLKNLLDWAARPEGCSAFLDRPAAVVSASPSAYGAAWAREMTEHVLTQMGARVLPAHWSLAHADRDAAQRMDPLINDAASDQLRAIISDLAAIVVGAPVPAHMTPSGDGWLTL